MPATRRLQAAVLGLAIASGWPSTGRCDESFEEGLRLFNAGRLPQAKAQFSSSSDPRAGILSAIVDAALGGCAEVLPELAAAAEEGDLPTARLAGLAAARCSIAAKSFGSALDTLTKLQAGHPVDPEVLYETARLHLKGWNEAVWKMFRLAPSSYRVNQLSAEIFEIQGRYDDAVREYRKAIQKTPGTLNLHYRLGRALLMRSHEPDALEEALGEFRAELELNPNDAVAEFQVGQILQIQGRPKEALPHLERALELDGEFPEALLAVARERTRLEQHEEAIALLERALNLQPQSEPAHYGLMLAYRNAGRLEDARRVQDALEKLQSPEDGEFNEFLKRIGEVP